MVSFIIFINNRQYQDQSSILQVWLLYFCLGKILQKCVSVCPHGGNFYNFSAIHILIKEGHKGVIFYQGEFLWSGHKCEKKYKNPSSHIILLLLVIRGWGVGGGGGGA